MAYDGILKLMRHNKLYIQIYLSISSDGQKCPVGPCLWWYFILYLRLSVINGCNDKEHAEAIAKLHYILGVMYGNWLVWHTEAVALLFIISQDTIWTVQMAILGYRKAGLAITFYLGIPLHVCKLPCVVYWTCPYITSYLGSAKYQLPEWSCSLTTF